MDNNIKRLRAARGLSQKDVADAMHVTVAQVSKWEGGKVNIPSSRMVALADLLRCPLGDLIGLPGFDITSEVEQKYLMTESTSLGTVADIPVHRTALGPTLEVEGQSVEQMIVHREKVHKMARRPVSLTGHLSVYGLYVSGSAMEPRFMDGELVLADPEGLVRNGDDVVIYLRPDIGPEGFHDNPIGILARLIRRTASYIELAQHFPAAVVRLEAADVITMDRVLPLSDLLA